MRPPELTSPLTATFHPLSNIAPFLSMSALVTTVLLSVSVRLVLQLPRVSDTMWYLFFCLAYFTQHNTLKFRPCCRRWKDFLPSMAEQYSMIYMCVRVYMYMHHTSLSIHVSMDTNHLHILAIVSKAAMNMGWGWGWGCRCHFKLVFRFLPFNAQKQDCWIILQLYC